MAPAGDTDRVGADEPTSPARADRSVRRIGTHIRGGNDVVIGRDLRADVRIAHPLISRAHLVLRFDQGRWVAIDNGSLNGMFVNGRRVPAIDITDGQNVNIGNPDGPRLTFEVGRHHGSVGRPPQTTSVPVAQRPSAAWPTQPPQTPRPPMPPGTSRPQPRYPTARSSRVYPSGRSRAGYPRRQPARPAP